MLFRPEASTVKRLNLRCGGRLLRQEPPLMVPGTGRIRMASKVCFCLGILGFSPGFLVFF